MEFLFYVKKHLWQMPSKRKRFLLMRKKKTFLSQKQFGHDIIRTVKEDIEGGSSLTDALKKHPKVFDELFVNLIAAGEAGGILDVVLGRLSNYLEKALKLKRKVKSAMTYPAAVLVISFLVVALLLIKVIPVFQKMFEGSGSELPGPTAMVIAMSDFAQSYWWIILGIIFVCIFAFRQFYKTES